MLISCPKCHSIYEIPDDLIGRTGKNFHCHACGNLWHAMREDALGYEEEVEEIPYLEAINVAEPPLRNYPANREFYTIPADTKAGRRTRSSKQIIEMEGDKDFVPKVKKQKQITLTSDYGTSFTIRAMPEDEPEIEQNQSQTAIDEKATKETAQKEFKGYPKTKFFLFILCLLAAVIFLRRDVVAFYPKAETWYNKVYLSGLHNPEYLRFENVRISEKNIDNQPHLIINADIVNPSRFATYIPPLTINGFDGVFAAEQELIRAGERFSTEIYIPVIDNIHSQSLTLSFMKP